MSHEVLPKLIIEAMSPLQAYSETMGAKPRAEDSDEMNWHAVAGRLLGRLMGVVKNNEMKHAHIMLMVINEPGKSIDEVLLCRHLYFSGKESMPN